MKKDNTMQIIGLVGLLAFLLGALGPFSTFLWNENTSRVYLRDCPSWAYCGDSLTAVMNLSANEQFTAPFRLGLRIEEGSAASVGISAGDRLLMSTGYIDSSSPYEGIYQAYSDDLSDTFNSLCGLPKAEPSTCEVVMTISGTGAESWGSSGSVHAHVGLVGGTNCGPFGTECSISAGGGGDGGGINVNPPAPATPVSADADSADYLVLMAIGLAAVAYFALRRG